MKDLRVRKLIAIFKERQCELSEDEINTIKNHEKFSITRPTAGPSFNISMSELLGNQYQRAMNTFNKLGVDVDEVVCFESTQSKK